MGRESDVLFANAAMANRLGFGKTNEYDGIILNIDKNGRITKYTNRLTTDSWEQRVIRINNSDNSLIESGIPT